jgi:hypothetical protein
MESENSSRTPEYIALFRAVETASQGRQSGQPSGFELRLLATFLLQSPRGLYSGGPGRADWQEERPEGSAQAQRRDYGFCGAKPNSRSALEGQNASLRAQLAAVQANHALLLGPFVSVDPNPEAGVAGPHITFSGVNIYIVSGLGATNDNGNPSGLGNLIIGYDEPPGSPETGPPLNPGDRGGSHGRFNRFTKTAFGGLVAGEANTISN